MICNSGTHCTACFHSKLVLVACFCQKLRILQRDSAIFPSASANFGSASVIPASAERERERRFGERERERDFQI